MADMPKSPFPTGFLGLDLHYDDVWNDVTPDLDERGLSLKHGASSEGAEPDASELGFTLTNSDARYSPRHPTSALYGKIGRNTPARATVALGAPWIDMPPGSTFFTADTAANSTPADIDVRWYGYRDDWSGTLGIFAKWNSTANQRAWYLEMAAGVPKIYFSSDGITPRTITCEQPIPASAGRIALRCWLDVSNGAGGVTATFWYAESLAGPWVQLGDPVSQTGTTALFNSSAPLQVFRSAGSEEVEHHVFGWELRNGNGGTVVSSVDTANLSVASPNTFTDDQGATWIRVGTPTVTNRRTVAVCEVAEWPMDWNTKGARSVLTDVSAAGPTRRLGQGEEALDSAVYSSIMNVDNPNLLAYWPMEDGTDARTFGPAVGRYTMHWGIAPTMASYAGFGGSNPLPVLGKANMRGTVRKASVTNGVQVRFLMHVPPAGIPADTALIDLNFYTDANPPDLAVARLSYQSGGALKFRGYNSDGTDIGGTNNVAFGVNGKNLRVSIELIQNGSAVDFTMVTIDAAGSGLGFGGSFPGRALTALRDVLINRAKVDLVDFAMGHVTFENSISTAWSVPSAVLAGYVAESASARLARLAGERGVPIVRRGAPNQPTAMGPQRADAFLNLMRETAAADAGILHDAQSGVALRYRSLASLGSQRAVVIPYEDNKVIPFEPSDDDGLTRNRATVERPNGTRATSEKLDGPMSIQTPDNGGVGLYDTSVTLNLNSDDDVRNDAAWRVHVGTWDEGRYPELGVDLADPRILADPVLVRDLLALTPGDRLVIEDPPAWLPPRAVDVIVMGIQMDITPHHLRIKWACRPARPYRVAYWNAGHRWSGEGTVLTSGVSDSATTLPLTLPEDVVWTHADGDYDILVGGELMTVTDVTGGNSMTVTRSVNGVVKTHSAGAAVALADPSFYAR